jgi:hypothetical protein
MISNKSPVDYYATDGCEDERVIGKISALPLFKI